MPQNRTLSVVVNQNVGLRAGAIGDGGDLAFDSGFCERVSMNGCGRVVPEFADVAGLQPPALASDDGSGHLPAGFNAERANVGF